ncbi:hypothetical protein Tco_1374442 [Tanacetum coccineum]
MASFYLHLGCVGICEESKGCHQEDSEFARRMGVLLQEMEARYNERVDFIKELEAVPGVDAAFKIAEFLNDAL